MMWMLLLATGVLHVAVAAFGAPAALQLPLAIFGAIYFGLGIWVKSGGRTAVLTALLVTLLGLTLGGRAYIQDGGPATMLVMFAIDFAVLAAAAFWLMKNKSVKKS
jgi:hypothetical protein